MALLHSLQICGVRSFSPENRETIYFNTPVTLFLGKNGCGKTTIIESIRFALTGELPAGSSNGQGFLNDPKISNKTSTKASVKIKFLDCQENSAWPLDEPKKLKEKFDEIFDAVKYNKCVDTIRKYIKEKQGNIKVFQERLSTKKFIKEDVERKRGKCDEKKNKLTEVRDKIKDKESETKPMEDRMKEILDLEGSLGTLQRKLTGKEAEKQGLIEQQNTIKEHISYIFEGSDEDLRNKIGSFQEEQESEENTIKDLEKRKKEVFLKSTEIGHNLQAVQVKIGQLKEEQKQHNKKIEENRELIEKARVKLQINSSTDLNNSKLVMSELQSALKQSEDMYEDLVKQNDQEEKELQNEIDELREKYVSTKQKISSKNGLIGEYQKKTRDINYKLEQLDTSDSQLRIVGETIKKHQNTLLNLKNSFNEVEKLQEIEELKEHIQVKEKFLDKLDREYRILQQNFVTEQKLESEKTIVIEKQGEINRIKTKHLQNFQKLFGDNIPERNYRRSVMDIQNKQELKYKALTDKINKLQKQVTTLEATIQHQTEKVESTQKELQNNKKKVANVCAGQPFIEVLNESHSKKEKLQRDKGQYSSAEIMYKAFINKFEKESPCCPVCQTDFSNKKSSVKEIILQLKNKIERIPNQLIQIDKDLKNEEELYNKLQQLTPVNDNIELLTNAKIPLMEEELNNTMKKLEDISSELVSEKKQFELNIINVPSNRSRQETEAEIDSVKAELSNLKNQYESNKMMVDSHRDRCQRLNTTIQNETQKQIDMQKLVQEKPLLEIQRDECTEKLMVLRTEVEELNDSLTNLEKELKAATEKKFNVVQSNRKTKEEMKNKIVSNKNMIVNIQILQSSIDLYIKNNSETKLKDAIAELAEYKTKEEKLEEAKNKISDLISIKKQNLAKQQINFRALTDNETLREKHKLESKLDEDINNLKKRIGDYNYKSIYEEKQKLQKRIDNYQREISSLTGQKEEILKQIEEIEDELEKPQNKNAYNNYKKQYYELRVQQIVIQDLSNYVNILERSVLQFHRERMVQINRTIRELWRNIYRGNDIDYIEIQTDESTIGGPNKRRTYNYKVVQVKKGIELEMRGRCSAGQKVLACLVIRMALAETFSAHCGILALDEPTTNLDKENILSLSDALSRIITVREKEKNFQLFIITHDEEFLNTLTRVQSLDSFWRVRRNEDGFSRVEKHLL
ncbi:hypothetical protein NQ314_000476 [Rhamnusium bicolor]|uniref:DNA repair protein RAD50 n=1 Tax=Rhamnusium bicolor TaxID=1586634 RepID=A0AAV8ZVB5_9CUCU|nr:hypothetical protein NQ314_000476 [Rhamnusium bicolor]